MFVKRKKRIELGGVTGANVTPLADVTTTLIVVFLVTMPSIMWSGIDVKATDDGGDQHLAQEIRNEQKDDMLTITVQEDGITVNREPVLFAELEEFLRAALSSREDKTVVVVPSDFVELGQVVGVLDAAKASGAGALALLNMNEAAR
jgi:biopolymer transport protein ExbD